MGTHPVFDDSFALEDAVVCLSDIALKLMIGLCTIAGASNRLSELHIVNQIEHMSALEDGVVFKQCCLEPGVTGMGIELANDIALGVLLHDE